MRLGIGLACGDGQRVSSAPACQPSTWAHGFQKHDLDGCWECWAGPDGHAVGIPSLSLRDISFHHRRSLDQQAVHASRG